MPLNNFINTINQNNRYTYIYHFTDVANFPQIKKHGLLSKNRMRQQCFWPDRPSGNQWSWDADDNKGISNYVSLCFTREHPMCHIAKGEGRITKPYYIAICPSVLRIEGVLLALDIANKAEVKLESINDALNTIDREVLYHYTDWKKPDVQLRLKAARKYEILVPNQVEQTYFKKVYKAP